MFDDFEPFDIKTQSDPDVTIHGISAGTGPPLLLLHGFPQTHHIWHLVAPQITSHFTIIIPDIRGYGASSKPLGVAQYAKSLMARDMVVLMSSLGFQEYYVCAHDRGARVAHKLLVDYKERVRKAIFLDICPTLAMFNQTNFAFAKTYWHWFFLIQQHPLPETLITSEPRKFAELFMGGRYGGIEKFDKGVFEEYVKGLEDGETVRGMCEDYRASSTLDMEESEKDLREGRKIGCQLRVLWGKHGVIESQFEALKEWGKVSERAEGVSGWPVNCGHYIPEENPEEVVKNIRELFV